MSLQWTAVATFLYAEAALGASSQAFRKQAEGASQAARQYLEDNDALRKQLQESGGAPSPTRDENETLKAKVESLKEELELSKKGEVWGFSQNSQNSQNSPKSRSPGEGRERGSGHAAPGPGPDP
ncbi:hypothetical protein RLOC_00003435 [Lonchura striata]|uniref:Uncharacterized protein n=1 Tax=Lonchura striata TaxID=40157 RepID=A0A218U886_9PASE|nr:hypothetical protein RLOC_00003435 [Lonchura striata domestica]